MVPFEQPIKMMRFINMFSAAFWASVKLYDRDKWALSDCIDNFLRDQFIICMDFYKICCQHENLQLFAIGYNWWKNDWDGLCVSITLVM